MTLAAMPSARVRTAVTAKPGERSIWRKAKRRSCSRLVMETSWMVLGDADVIAGGEPKGCGCKCMRMQSVGGSGCGIVFGFGVEVSANGRRD